VRPEQLEFVLVRPARPHNVAAAARALKNMGWSRLTLVDAPETLDPQARALAYGAWDVLDAAASAERLEQAVATCAFVVGASARGGEGAWTPRQLAERADSRAAGGRVALVFGPEASGLGNAELALCHETVTIPTSVRQPSLNLAQAVLVLAYELRLAGVPSQDEPQALPATTAAVEDALAELRRALLSIGYLNPDNPDAILSELRRLLSRAGPSPREAGLLRGMARQIAWAGGELQKRPETGS
jgi:TrmH family RNA methyltransferase